MLTDEQQQCLDWGCNWRCDWGCDLTCHWVVCAYSCGRNDLHITYRTCYDRSKLITAFMILQFYVRPCLQRTIDAAAQPSIRQHMRGMLTQDRIAAFGFT